MKGRSGTIAKWVEVGWHILASRVILSSFAIARGCFVYVRPARAVYVRPARINLNGDDLSEVSPNGSQPYTVVAPQSIARVDASRESEHWAERFFDWTIYN